LVADLVALAADDRLGVRSGQGRACIRPAMPVTATDIRQIELELYKAERGLGMPYDGDRVAQLRRMLREARKRKLSARLAAKRGRPSDER
jgi:hypothetical protein